MRRGIPLIYATTPTLKRLVKTKPTRKRIPQMNEQACNTLSPKRQENSHCFQEHTSGCARVRRGGNLEPAHHLSPRKTPYLALVRRSNTSWAAGFEPATDPCNSKDLQESIDETAGKSQDSGAKTAPPPAPTDPDLSLVIDAWPELSDAIKAALLAIVKTTRRLAPSPPGPPATLDKA